MGRTNESPEGQQNPLLSLLHLIIPDDVLDLLLPPPRWRGPLDLSPLGGRGEGFGSLGGLSMELDRDLVCLEVDTFNLLQ